MRTGKNFASMSDPGKNPGFRRHWTEPPHSKNPSIVGSAAAEIVSDLQYRQTVERVHSLGSRVLAELLAELGIERKIMPGIREKLERYASIDPEALEALGGDRFPPLPIHEVQQSGPRSRGL